jgi:hypothetical protein
MQSLVASVVEGARKLLETCLKDVVGIEVLLLKQCWRVVNAPSLCRSPVLNAVSKLDSSA